MLPTTRSVGTTHGQGTGTKTPLTVTPASEQLPPHVLVARLRTNSDTQDDPPHNTAITPRRVLVCFCSRKMPTRF